MEESIETVSSIVILPTPPIDETVQDWQQWCRLCAKDEPTDNISLLLKKEPSIAEDSDNADEKQIENLYLLETIRKHLRVTIKKNETLPKMVCTDCCTRIKSFITFNERVAKVQQMFSELCCSPPDSNIDLARIRKKYGIIEEESKENIQQQQQFQEIEYLDQKLETDGLEEEMLDFETNTSNPLEQKLMKLEEQIFLDDNEAAMDGFEEAIENESNGNTNDTENAIENMCNESEQEDHDFIEHTEIESMYEELEEEGEEEESLNEKSPPNDNLIKKYIYKCPECARVFKHANNVRRHMKHIHPNATPKHKCTKCTLVFLTEQLLDKHMKIHDTLTEKYVRCPYCEKELRPNSLQKHIDFLHLKKNQNSFICEQCGATFHSKGVLRCHRLIHSDYAPYECEVCKRKFKKKFLLTKHMDVHDPIKYICPECGRQLNSRATLSVHLQLHSNTTQFNCEFCGRFFPQARSLQYHLIHHAGLKPFLCEFCGNSFSQKGSYHKHKRLEHFAEMAAVEEKGEEPCKQIIPDLETLKDICRNIRDQKDGIGILRNTPTKGSITPTTVVVSRVSVAEYESYSFQCALCKKKFKHKGTLKKHIETHDPIKPVCLKCGHAFNSRASLRQHLSIHTDNKQYQCESCDRSFRARREYVNHMTWHSGLKPYVCDFCTREFTSRSACRYHKRIKHPQELAAQEAASGLFITTSNDASE